MAHWSVWPAAAGCLVGAFLLSGAHELRIGLGDLWVLASALPWAVQSCSARAPSSSAHCELIGAALAGGQERSLQWKGRAQEPEQA